MFRLSWLPSFLIVAACVSGSRPAVACDACACTFNSKRASNGHAAGPMITTPTANTLGQGHGSAGFLFEHQRYNAIPAGDAHALHHAGRDVHGKAHQEFYNLSLGYGVSDRLDLFLTAPIVSKSSIEIHSHSRLGQKEDAVGFGDLRLVGKYRFWDEGVDAALLLSVKAPTGATAVQNSSGGKFEAEQQPGSGSWDLISGLVVSRSIGRHVSLANAFRYTTRGEGGQEHKMGDVFHYGLGASYALKPLGDFPNASVVLELHHEWARRDHSREDDRVLDSGGITILLSPGLSVDLTRSLSAFAAMPIPVYQDLGGEHEELTYGVIAGVAWHF